MPGLPRIGMAHGDAPGSQSGRIVSATGAERCSCWARAPRLDSGAASSSVDVDLGGPQRLFKEAAAGL